jgi:tetratricopeptide (TPR) repeat protein
MHRQVIALVEKRDYAELERLLGGLQLAFEQDPAQSEALEKAFGAFEKLPRSRTGALDEWVLKYPASYVARTARGTFHVWQGLDARGTASIADTPEENLETMRAYFDLGWKDLERSLRLSPKPYLSRYAMLAVEKTAGSATGAREHYQEAVKLAPQSIDLRLARMASLEPRWGGSYPEMEAFLAQARAELKDPTAVARLAARIPANRAQERRQAKDYVQALKLYDEAIALYPAAGTLCNRSYVLGQLDREREAFADVKLALSKVRDNRYCLERAVYLAAKIPENDEAIQVLTLVTEVDRSSVYAFTQRGWRYRQVGKLDLALQDYVVAAKLGDAWAQLQAGKAYWGGHGVKEDREEALVWLRKAAAQGNADAKLSLEQAQKQQGIKTN